MPFPMPPVVSSDSQQQINAWLHVFNAGILNFTLIATAAVLQARSRGLDRLPLWQIITDFVDEAGRNVSANGGQYVEAVPSVLDATSPRQRPHRRFKCQLTQTQKARGPLNSCQTNRRVELNRTSGIGQRE